MSSARFIFLLLASILASAACTTIDKAGLAKVKRVAIVGLEVKIEGEGSDLKKYAQYYSDQKFGPKIYQVVQRQLEKAFKWKVVGLEAVTSNKSYLALEKQAVSQITKALAGREFIVMIPDMMKASTATAMLGGKSKYKKKILKELGVDSFLMIQVSVRPQPVPVGLVAKVSPAAVDVYESSVSLKIFNREKDDAVWDKKGFTGENADDPTPSLFGITFPNAREKAVVSSFVNAMKEAIHDVNAAT